METGRAVPGIVPPVIHRFETFELDPARAELRREDSPVPVEPQVFALLLLLVENADRLVSRDEIVEKVWDGRVVSDAAISSRVKSARRAIGDDGRSQRLIRTVHGRGFRFVADVRAVPRVARGGDEPRDAEAPAQSGRPSIAVLALGRVGDPTPDGAVAEALADELITELARLRWLFVVARGSSFRLRPDAVDPADVGRLLGVRYVVTGSVETSGRRLVVSVRLTQTHDANVLWAERYGISLDDVQETPARIASSVVSALELRIPEHEATVAKASPGHLDAWTAYHLGRHHMFRFNRSDNAFAGECFDRAIDLDPSFARAHAGRSFVHFQNAFLHFVPHDAASAALARSAAERAVELDSLDPFANFSMGRAHWLERDLDSALIWIERSVALCPNYAQGVYARAWTHTLSGRGREGQRDADAAMALSPLDPLHYAMTATRALSHIVRSQHDDGATWAELAARSPGAHVMIAMIAVAAHSMRGDSRRADAWAAEVRRRAPTLGLVDFLASFPFPDPSVRDRISTALAAHGF